mmetsp:Transcript_4011/g.13464  ORF Transcript_4011/g.13464 Transcript_4011/m.13464 type:complete len:297 (-) Transcript_4011:1057-1947(-)
MAWARWRARLAACEGDNEPLSVIAKLATSCCVGVRAERATRRARERDDGTRGGKLPTHHHPQAPECAGQMPARPAREPRARRAAAGPSARGAPAPTAGGFPGNRGPARALAQWQPAPHIIAHEPAPEPSAPAADSGGASASATELASASSWDTREPSGSKSCAESPSSFHICRVDQWRLPSPSSLARFLELAPDHTVTASSGPRTKSAGNLKASFSEWMDRTFQPDMGWGASPALRTVKQSWARSRRATKTLGPEGARRRFLEEDGRPGEMPSLASPASRSLSYVLRPRLNCADSA